MPALHSLQIIAFLAFGLMQLVSAAATNANLPSGKDFTVDGAQPEYESDDSLLTARGYTGKGGCYYGYCWAGCSTGLSGARDPHEWCYTTKGWSQDQKYVKCSYDSECNLGWKCATRCGLF